MNIIGEGFPEAINKQVIQRQKIYGSGYIPKSPLRDSSQIIYLNANTSWCKLVSSVNVKNKSIIVNSSLSNENIAGNELAKKFVLFNGVFDTTDGEQRSGIDTSKSILGYNYAYGIGGTEFGLRPMMGIQSAEIRHENRGSIRRATVKIKAFNKIQFDIIDILYLRLGFNILLEWGHTMYYDNEGELHTGSDIENSLAKEFLDGKGTKTIISYYTIPDKVPVSKEIYGNLSYYDFLQLIQKRRISSCGNYDAMFAKVNNHSWTFNPDGSYDITLNLVSVGDVVESFKINALSNSITTSNQSTKSENKNASDKELISLYANKNTIGWWFNSLTGPNESNKTESQEEKNFEPVSLGEK